MTKMMRNDREDMRDIAFILEQEAIGASALRDAFGNARVIEMPELQALFIRMQPAVLNLARVMEHTRSSGGASKEATYTLDPDWWEKLTNVESRRSSPEKDLGLSREP